MSIDLEKKLDSLITDPVSFNILLAQVNKIESEFSNRDSIAYSIPSEEWGFICSYKNGWEEIIGGLRNDSSGIAIHRQEFNDIHVSRHGTSFFTTDELKKIFHLDDSRFAKDASGNIISAPIVITKNRKYLIIRSGHCYPNGNQTSWCYSLNYYFRRGQE